MRNRSLWWAVTGLLVLGAVSIASAGSRTRDGDDPADAAVVPLPPLSSLSSLAPTKPLAPRSAFSCKSGEVAICRHQSKRVDANCVAEDKLEGELLKGATLAAVLYPDVDADSFGEMGTPAVNGCVEIAGYVTNDADCDDTNALVNPGAGEDCDLLDNNCDGQIDEGACDRITFLTSSTHTGNLGGVPGADAICQARADEAGLPGTYLAFITGADPMSDPYARFTHSSLPYVRVDGVIVALDFFDLIDGNILNPINITENGDYAGSTGGVYTNTNQFAMQRSPDAHCNDWSDDRPSIYMSHNGNFGQIIFLWTNGGIGPCTLIRHLYCFQQ